MYSNQISLGMRFRMMCETEELGTRRYAKLPVQTLIFQVPSLLTIHAFYFPISNINVSIHWYVTSSKLAN
jgi:hypothetical protein